jgi:uncharacterized phiE125 gp8 family phage protein
MIYQRVGAAASPVSLEEVKAHLDIEAADTSRDLVLAAYLDAAAALVDGRDGILGRALVTQSWQALADRPRCGGGFLIELGPFQAVSKVEHLVDGVYLEVPAADYAAQAVGFGHALILPKAGKSWPDADCHGNAWRVTFTAGYGAAADVPAPIRVAVLLMVADLFDNPDAKASASSNPTVARLLAPFGAVWG